MGYSVFIIAKNKDLQSKMELFIEKNLINFNKFFFDDDNQYFGLRIGTEDSNSISYKARIKNDLVIGFDYNCGGGERVHMYEIIKWMAEKIGQNPNVYYYDGELTKIKKHKSIKEHFDAEAEKMYDRKESNDKTTLNQVRIEISSWELSVSRKNKSNTDIDKEINERIEFIDNDIKRLNELWNTPT